MTPRDLADELGKADLGDKRLTKRLEKLVGALAENPDKSLPEALGTDAALEGAYRFLNNESVAASDILEPHFRATAERAAEARDIVVAHDTTEFRFEGKRHGLGRLRGNDQGFLGHFALAITADEQRRPLGVVDLITLVRGPEKKGQKHPRERALDPNKESLRWLQLMSKAVARLEHVPSVIHVMDSEADNYELLSRMLDTSQRFVFRMRHDRLLCSEGAERVSEALDAAPCVATREVALERRVASALPRQRKTHPARTSRLAKLGFAATRAQLQRPSHLKEVPSSLDVNLIRVWEIDAPVDVTPVEWTLVTTDPVGTEGEILRAVDAYRARWRIEEFFKALKTGCVYEERQLESLHALLNLLAVSIPIAWKLLLLRSMAHETPDAPASAVLDAVELEVLAAAAPKHKLGKSPTAQAAMLAVAALGGHQKNNGPPGWQVLGRGLRKLQNLADGWRLARGKM